MFSANARHERPKGHDIPFRLERPTRTSNPRRLSGDQSNGRTRALRPGRVLAVDLRQRAAEIGPLRPNRGRQRGGVEEIVERVRDILLVDVERRARAELGGKLQERIVGSFSGGVDAMPRPRAINVVLPLTYLHTERGKQTIKGGAGQ